MDQTLAPPADSAVAVAYDAIAPAYDILTAGYCYEQWLPRIESLATRYGLSGRRLLDLACGTGKSFVPLAELGYEVTACDISPRMAEQAQRKWPLASISVQDIAALPRLGEFDLITCLDDSVNYLLSRSKLESFFAGVARNLRPGGVGIFDVNSRRAYEQDFARTWVLDDPDAFIVWSAAPYEEGHADSFRATVEVFEPHGAGWRRTTSEHTQRHWSVEELTDRAAGAGLVVRALHGQHRGARIDESFDESVHTKGLYFLTHERKERIK